MSGRQMGRDLEKVLNSEKKPDAHEENPCDLPGGFQYPPKLYKKNVRQRLRGQEDEKEREERKQQQVIKLIHFDQNIDSNTDDQSYDEIEVNLAAFKVMRKRSQTHGPLRSYKKKPASNSKEEVKAEEDIKSEQDLIKKMPNEGIKY